MRKDKQNRNCVRQPTTNKNKNNKNTKNKNMMFLPQEFHLFFHRRHVHHIAGKKKRKKEKQSHQQKVYFQKKILFIFSIVKSVQYIFEKKKKDINHRTSKKYSDECHTTHLNATSLTVLPTCLISTELSHYNVCLICFFFWYK